MNEYSGKLIQAVVGSIVWAFRSLEKPSSRKISARVYALQSVDTQLYFLFSDYYARRRSIYYPKDNNVTVVFEYCTFPLIGIPYHNLPLEASLIRHLLNSTWYDKTSRPVLNNADVLQISIQARMEKFNSLVSIKEYGKETKVSKIPFVDKGRAPGLKWHFRVTIAIGVLNFTFTMLKIPGRKIFRVRKGWRLQLFTRIIFVQKMFGTFDMTRRSLEGEMLDDYFQQDLLWKLASLDLQAYCLVQCVVIHTTDSHLQSDNKEELTWSGYITVVSMTNDGFITQFHS